jgi:hypothetical protein
MPTGLDPDYDRGEVMLADRVSMAGEVASWRVCRMSRKQTIRSWLS